MIDIGKVVDTVADVDTKIDKSWKIQIPIQIVLQEKV